MARAITSKLRSTYLQAYDGLLDTVLQLLVGPLSCDAVPSCSLPLAKDGGAQLDWLQPFILPCKLEFGQRVLGHLE